MENMELNAKKRSDVFKIDPRAIVVVDGFNSRRDFGDLEELASQIKEQGMLNPISVKPFTEDGVEKYKLVDGERRYRATMLLINQGVDIARVPALFVSKSTSEFDMVVQQLMRNEGKPFNEYELGIAYQKMLSISQMTRDELAQKLGYTTKENKCRTWRIDVALKHLERDERVQELLRADKIDGSLVRQIYQAHPNDEEGAVEEILNLKNKVATSDTPKKKLTAKDLDSSSKTLLVKDSQAIKKGLKALVKYLAEYTDEDGNITIDVDIIDIMNALNKQTTIKDILDGYAKQMEIA